MIQKLEIKVISLYECAKELNKWACIELGIDPPDHPEILSNCSAYYGIIRLFKVHIHTMPEILYPNVYKFTFADKGDRRIEEQSLYDLCQEYFCVYFEDNHEIIFVCKDIEI